MQIYLLKLLICAVCLSLICAALGHILVLRHLSLSGDTLSHGALAGVTLGFACGINPTVTALIFTVICAAVIECLRRYYPQYSEIVLAIMMSVTIALAAIFANYAFVAGNLSAFLFGSLASVCNFDLLLIIVLTVIVLIYFIVLQRYLLLISLEEKVAAVQGLPVNLINISLSVITAITVASAAKVAGTLVISGLLVLPAAAAMLLKKGYYHTLYLSVLIALINSFGGIILSYLADIPLGGAIILSAALSLSVCLLVKISRVD